MQANQTPTLVPLAFAANGAKNVIPEASQITITPGAASLNDGFPPITDIPIAAGGIAPAYGDFNGILNLITASIRWAHGGGQYAWNSAFTTDANVAGYPNGAQLMRADLTGHWINTVDSNETNPDAVDGSAAGWVPGYNYGIFAVTGLTNANVTLFPLQASKSRITLAGALTGNVQIIFPAWLKEWEVVNNTTGAFTVTAKTAAGTGVVLAAGQQKITGDGTNITQPAESIPPATQPQHAVQFGQVSGVVGQVRNLVSSVAAASATKTVAVDEIIAETALGGLRYCLSGLNLTGNLATQMDTGTAPVSGFVAEYVIYNPNAAISGTNPRLLYTNATAAKQPEVYGGANPVAGYTVSALSGVWPTNASGLFVIGVQIDRSIAIANNTVLSTSTNQATPLALSIANAAPKNARTVSGQLSAGTTVSAASSAITVFASSVSVGGQTSNTSVNASGPIATSFNKLSISLAQTIYYITSTNAGTGAFTVVITEYDF